MINPDCIFCKIIAQQLPSFKLYEDDTAYAFLDINPFEEGHSLVIPKYHAETLLDLPEDILAACSHAIPRLARQLVTALKADGFNVLQSNGKCATQVVPHVHFHIIPRWNDRAMSWIGRPDSRDALAALHRKIIGA